VGAFILAIEAMMLVAGLGALITGRFPIGMGRYTRGIGSRLAGIIFAAPLPVCFTIGYVLGSRGVQPDGTSAGYFEFWAKLVLLEIGIVLGCAVTGFLLAALTYDPFSEYNRKKRKGKLRSRRPGDPFDDEEAAARWSDDEDDAPRPRKKKRRN
jgi:hypothetical protein